MWKTRGISIVRAMPNACRRVEITGTTRVFHILGNPVEQVRAPELFNHLFQRHGVDAVLVPAAVSAQDLPGFVSGIFAASNMGGLWVTIPHKGALQALVTHCDRRGQVAQAVNAVRRHADGSLEGALFDGVGFVKGLDGWGVACEGARALVVGVGGAGTAIAVSLAERGVAELSLYSLDTAATQTVATRIGLAFPGVRVHLADDADPAGQDIVVNATPLGLREGDPFAFNPARLQPGAAVVDILMKNQPTPLLQACAAAGARAFPGFEMMIRQAPEYLDFFGLHELARVMENDATEVRRLIELN